MPVVVRATPPGMLARFQALLGFAQNLAVLLALPGLGWLAGSAGLRAALGLVAVLLLASAALPRTAADDRPACAGSLTPRRPRC